MGWKKVFHPLLVVYLAELAWSSNVTVCLLAYNSSRAKFGIAGLFLSTEMGFISFFDTDVDLVFFEEAFRARGRGELGVDRLYFRSFFGFLDIFGVFDFTLDDFKDIFVLIVVTTKSLAEFDGESLLLLGTCNVESGDQFSDLVRLCDGLVVVTSSPAIAERIFL